MFDANNNISAKHWSYCLQHGTKITSMPSESIKKGLRVDHIWWCPKENGWLTSPLASWQMLAWSNNKSSLNSVGTWLYSLYKSIFIDKLWKILHTERYVRWELAIFVRGNSNPETIVFISINCTCKISMNRQNVMPEERFGNSWEFP